ncbi:amidohydrolase [Nesterenkonia rhizosphaerae]|uniref:Amidohydrolase n=1 Tax=Nesterenkonia rhizosphaerae TaxID=1348272 RepID=A0ABP9FWX1_9MICC
MSELLLKNAVIASPGGAKRAEAPAVDVLISGGVVVALTASGEQLDRAAEVVDLEGRWLIPGLWDHHVHFTQWVIRRQRIDLTRTSSAAEVLELAREAVQKAPAGKTVVGFGFRDGLWPEPARLSDLDAVTGDHPVALIAGDLHCMWLNTAAQQLVGVHTDDTGILREAESFAVMDRFGDPADLTPQDYQDAAQAAAARGTVGVVEFENADNASLWPKRVAQGVNQLRVEAAVWPDYLAQTVKSGLRTGDLLEESGLVRLGPLKVISDGSLNTRTAWCWESYAGLDPTHPHACGGPTVPPQQVRELMRTAQGAGIAAAIHAIGDRANTEILTIFEQLAMHGSIEHAQLLRWEDVERFARLGVTASVQPEHAMDDRDVAEAYWPGRTARNFPLRSLVEAGVTLRFGSDAPVAPLDPWMAIAAAVSRSRDGRDPWHPEQRIAVGTALAASTGGPAEVRVGAPADLAVLDRDPYHCTGDQLRNMPVAATLLGGRFTHYAL